MTPTERADKYTYWCPYCKRAGFANLVTHDILNGWRCPDCRHTVRIYQVRFKNGEYERIEIPT